VGEIVRAFPQAHVRRADCQESLPYASDHFDRVLAIHVLEHLPRLPSALAEIHRVLRADGELVVVIPCDPGVLYRVARWLSAERLFRKRYGQPYRWFIDREHINTPHEILEELGRLFTIEHRRFFPLRVPVIDLNLCLGLVLRKAAVADDARDGARAAMR
jgi:SAM-dependent methyltransferase